MEEKMIVEENEELSCEEKKEEYFYNLECKEITNIAKQIYKKGLFDKEIIKEFNFDDFTDYTYGRGVSGHDVFVDQEDNIVLVKELALEEGMDAYGYEVVHLATLNEEELSILMHDNKKIPVITWILLGFFALFLTFSMVTWFDIFFNYVSNDFEGALQYSFWMVGGALTVAFGIAALLSFKLCKKCCK